MTTAWHRRSEDGANFPSRSCQWPCTGQRAALKGSETCSLFFSLGNGWDWMKTSLKTCGFRLCQSCCRPPTKQTKLQKQFLKSQIVLYFILRYFNWIFEHVGTNHLLHSDSFSSVLVFDHAAHDN